MQSAPEELPSVGATLPGAASLALIALLILLMTSLPAVRATLQGAACLAILRHVHANVASRETGFAGGHAGCAQQRDSQLAL